MSDSLSSLMSDFQAKYGTVSSGGNDSQLVADFNTKYGPIEKEHSDNPIHGMKHTSNEVAWEKLMSGGEALPADNKFTPAQQLAVGVISAVNQVPKRIMQVGQAANTLATAGINKLSETLGTGGDLVKTPIQNGVNVVEPFEKNEQEIRRDTNDYKALSNGLFGINTANTGQFAGDIVTGLLAPGSSIKQGATALETIANAGVAGAITGSLFGASENYKGSASNIATGTAIGGTVGAVTGAGAQGISEAVQGVLKYAGNRWLSPNKKDLNLSVNKILGNVGDADSAAINLENKYKANPLADQGTDITPKVYNPLSSYEKTISPADQSSAGRASKIAQGIYDDISDRTRSVTNPLYDKADAIQVPTDFLKSIKNDPNLDRQISAIRQELSSSNNPLALRYQLLNEPSFNGRLNKNANPESLENYRLIVDTMKDKINYNSKQGMTQGNQLLNDSVHKLTSLMDNVSPEYQLARGLVYNKNLIKEAFDNVGLNTIGKGETEAYKKLNSLLIDTKLPISQLRTIRDTFVQQNPEVWKSIVRESLGQNLNKVKGINDTVPLDFMSNIFNNKGKENLIQEALNFPGNETTVMKFKALSEIYKQINEPTTISSITDKLPIVNMLKGSKANEFNKTAMRFINNPDFDHAFNSIINNKELTDSAKINEVIKMLLPHESIGNTGQVVHKSISIPLAKVASQPSEKDNKR